MPGSCSDIRDGGDAAYPQISSVDGVKMNNHIGIVLCFALLLLPGPVANAAESTTQADEAAATLATQVCSSCHSPGGDSKSPTFPKLAAQQQQYLVA